MDKETILKTNMLSCTELEAKLDELDTNAAKAEDIITAQKAHLKRILDERIYTAARIMLLQQSDQTAR